MLFLFPNAELMNYENQPVRRQDRLLEEKEALHLLQQGEYGVLSMVKDEGHSAYGIPLNYVWDGQSAIYLHGAPEGEKLRCIRAFPEVSFCVVGTTKVIPNQFTTAFESIVLTCSARVGLPDEERMHALKLLLEKYSPQDVEVGLAMARKSFARTEIIRLDIRKWSGKCKRMA